MLIFPAIDLFSGKAVRLFKGDYAQMTVYNENPLAVAEDFKAAGATCLHVVDLEGAKSGETPNIDTVTALASIDGLFVEVGGGIRSMEVVDRYLEAGVDRVILGTAAVTDPEFLGTALAEYGERVAVGVDIKDGMVAIKGWTEVSDMSCDDFCAKLEKMGVGSVICTDISKDGMMSGTNLDLYRELCRKFNIKIVASGGVSSLDDVKALVEMDVFGAILGKALYTGAIDLREAVKLTEAAV